MKNNRLLVSACFALLALSAVTAGADGGYFSRPRVTSVAVSADQRAIIVRSGYSTTLTLSTAYTGDGEDFAWIIPCPAAPWADDVTQAGESGETAFEILDTITAPRIRLDQSRGSSIGGTRGGAVQEAPPVQVRARFLLASYEVSILGASSSAGLAVWLKDNSYSVTSEAQSVLAGYIARDWAFVAIKLRPEDTRHYSDEFLPPVTIRYQSDQFVFPLRISAVSTVQAAKITLYVIARSTVRSLNLITRQVAFEPGWSDSVEERVESSIRQATGAEGRATALLWCGIYRPGAYWDATAELGATVGTAETGEILWAEEDPELDRAEPGSPGDPLWESLKRVEFPTSLVYITRLEARMGPAAMTEDLVLVEDRTPQEFSVTGSSLRPGGLR